MMPKNKTPLQSKWCNVKYVALFQTNFKQYPIMQGIMQGKFLIDILKFLFLDRQSYLVMPLIIKYIFIFIIYFPCAMQKNKCKYIGRT